MAHRLFVTGDTHGDYDIGKLSSDRFDSRKLDKDDYLIVAGDFGLVFHPVQSTGREEYWLRWLAQKPFTTLFVDGNHENFDRLNEMPVEMWHGGRVHRINDSVLHLMRGEAFLRCFLQSSSKATGRSSVCTRPSNNQRLGNVDVRRS